MGKVTVTLNAGRVSLFKAEVLHYSQDDISELKPMRLNQDLLLAPYNSRENH